MRLKGHQVGVNKATFLQCFQFLIQSNSVGLIRQGPNSFIDTQLVGCICMQTHRVAMSKGTTRLIWLLHVCFTQHLDILHCYNCAQQKVITVYFVTVGHHSFVHSGIKGCLKLIYNHIPPHPCIPVNRGGLTMIFPSPWHLFYLGIFHSYRAITILYPT